MRRFTVHSPFAPAGDQPQAIRELVDGINSGLLSQVLLGVTGSGKTLAEQDAGGATVWRIPRSIP